jgi:hypothetical protein
MILPEPVRRGRPSSKSRSAELYLGLIDVVCGDFRDAESIIGG